MLRVFLGLLGFGLVAFANAAHAQTLDSIRTARHMDCGAVLSADDWNGQDIHGNLSALGGEICRAIAIAILGDTANLTIQSFPAELEALNALKSGAIQVAVGVSPSAATAMQFGVGFGPPVFYDSQRFMVSKLSGVTELAGLRDKLICALDMTPPERALRDEMTVRGISYGLQAHSEQGEMDAAGPSADAPRVRPWSRGWHSRALTFTLGPAISYSCRSGLGLIRSFRRIATAIRSWRC
jgi:general L-amino acid transport system substrate-binding protein